MFKKGDLVRIVVLDESDGDDYRDIPSAHGYIWTVTECEPIPEPDEGDYDVYLMSLATGGGICFFMFLGTYDVPGTNLRLEKADV